MITGCKPLPEATVAVTAATISLPMLQLPAMTLRGCCRGNTAALAATQACRQKPAEMEKQNSSQHGDKSCGGCRHTVAVQRLHQCSTEPVSVSESTIQHLALSTIRAGGGSGSGHKDAGIAMMRLRALEFSHRGCLKQWCQQVPAYFCQSLH
jgi:hypothetical protein